MCHRSSVIFIFLYPSMFYYVIICYDRADTRSRAFFRDTQIGVASGRSCWEIVHYYLHCARTASRIILTDHYVVRAIYSHKMTAMYATVAMHDFLLLWSSQGEISWLHLHLDLVAIYSTPPQTKILIWIQTTATICQTALRTAPISAMTRCGPRTRFYLYPKFTYRN
jgi:hypothetical protein